MISTETFDVLIIGGGASGLIAASRAAENGKKVAVLEKNAVFAKKVRITGKGRCNLTNSCDSSAFMQNIPRNGKFLYSAFNSFSNLDCIDFFEKNGVATKVERGNRVFPVSDSAHDIAKCLIDSATKNGAKLLKNHAVKRIATENGSVIGVQLIDDSFLPAKSVIIATGGMSYTGTGSTGDGYEFSRALGHSIIPPKPSLVPLNTAEKLVKDLSGLALKNVAIKVVDSNNKTIYEDFGELLFTHFGLSGPIILSASAHINDFSTRPKIFIDLKPALTTEILNKRVQSDFAQYVNKDFTNSLDDLLPKSLIPIIVNLCQIPTHQKVNQISKEQRLKLVELLKNLPLTITSARPIEEAIITSGGVNVREINPSTMESKLINGLFFAGEVIDVDAYTGGFNLQIAFSTGYLAGSNA
ncbi:lipoprotein [Clostridia bacterium]|nr:lipoprotein [Clostridia bacterium]